MRAFQWSLIYSATVAVLMAPVASYANNLFVCRDLYRVSVPKSAQVPIQNEGVRVSQFEPPKDLRVLEIKGRSVTEVIENASREIETRLKGILQAIPKASGATFAFNLSGGIAKVEVVSSGVGKAVHDRFVAEFQAREIVNIFASVPAKLRNKYFEISLGKDKEVSVELKFAWELPFEFRSQLLTGFGETKTEVITPYHEGFSPEAKVRRDLIDSGISQETGATCGIGSVCQVMHTRRTPVGEWQLLERANNIKNEFEVVGSKDPGLSIYELVELIKDFRKANRLDFRVETEIVRDESGLAKFRELVRQASIEGNGVDIIVNLWSPTIGRAGTGHFLPIAGYNPKTDYVLMSETNLAFNKLYWVHLPTLYKSVTSDAQVERGYLIIR